MFYINKAKQIYGGDMALGDCEARPDEIEDDRIAKLPTPLQQIRALEQKHDDDQRKFNRQAAIDVALSVACRSPAAAGKTRAEVHDIWYALNRGYRAMVMLEAQIVELRKQIV